MNHKPPVEAYNSLLFDKANLKRIRVIIKHRHEFINVSQKLVLENYLTIGAVGADTSTRLISAFSGRAIKAL
jgi:hypothetical protein